MGFLDKVKTTAGKAADKAQQAVDQGQQKLGEIQEKRKTETLLRDLGAGVFLDKTGRGTPAVTADIERLIAAVRELEESGVEIDPPKAPEPGSPASTEPGSAEPGSAAG